MSEPIFCRGCGEVHEEATARLAALEEERNLAERELRGKRSQIARLKGEQASARPPEYDDAMEVAEFWKCWCRPRAKELNGPRLAKTIERLHHGYEKDDLIKAVWGYYCRPNIKDGKRVRAVEGTRYDDLELIMRDAKRVDTGIHIADEEARYDQGTLNQGGRRELAELCDCGHPRVEHGLLWMQGHDACYAPECHCLVFDDINQRSEEWLRQRDYELTGAVASSMTQAQGKLL